MKQNRRDFIKAAGAAIALPTIIPSSVLGENAPSKRITLGFIGMGSQGINMNLRNFYTQKDAHVVAVCDAYMSRAEKAAKMVNEKYGNTDCKVYQDFRKIIDDKSIDAVVISTPDHWHVPMSIMAMKEGKDVFCEKPTYCIDEGQDLVKEAEKRKIVFQAGIEDRSTIHFHKMVEWVKNGAIGKLCRIEVTLPNGPDFPKEDPVKVPDDLDWNMWLGPAPFHEYTPNRTSVNHWRNISDYSTGKITDWGAHLVDTAQIGVNAPDVCPVEVEGTGFIPQGRLTNVPIRFDLNYKYSNGVELNVKNGGSGIKFIGDKGWVQRSKWGAGLEASDKSILHTKYTPETTKHWPFPKNEQRNFLDCVKSRKPTTYTAKDLHEMSTTLHMGVMAVELGRKLTWNTDKQEFVKDKEANSKCERPKHRKWWKV